MTTTLPEVPLAKIDKRDPWRKKAKRQQVTAVVAAGLAVLAGVAISQSDHAKAQPAPVTIPACLEDEVVSADATCVHPDTADFRQGYWYADKGGE
jgi:hypothetical protein